MAPLSFKVNTEYAQISEIVPHLFICGVSALTQSNMIAFDIGLIINATKEVPNLRSLGDIQRIKLWIDDVSDEDLSPHFSIISDQIHATIQDGGNVLVHCVAGVSRSASICLAYLTKYYCRSLRQAYHLMCQTRPMVRPNLGFWRQLIHFEQLEKGYAGSVRIVRDDAQPEQLLPDVYLKNVILERPISPERVDAMDEGRERRHSGPGKLKFFPVLEPLIEMAEANFSRQESTTIGPHAVPDSTPASVSAAMTTTPTPAAIVEALTVIANVASATGGTIVTATNPAVQVEL